MSKRPKPDRRTEPATSDDRPTTEDAISDRATDQQLERARQLAAEIRGCGRRHLVILAQQVDKSLAEMSPRAADDLIRELEAISIAE